MNNVVSDIANVAKHDISGFFPGLLGRFLHPPQKSFWSTIGLAPHTEASCGQLAVANGLVLRIDTCSCIWRI